MAENEYVNRVDYGNDTLIDISDTTAEAGDVLEGETFYLRSGAPATGTLGDATTSAHGLMSAADKTKLDSLSNIAYQELEVVITTSDWSVSSPYTYTWNSVAVTSNSIITVVFKTDPRPVFKGDLNYDKVTGGVQFTASTLPTGTLTLMVQIIDSEISYVVDSDLIRNQITTWLNDNISGGSGVAIDSTLEITGAAADAKVTGDEISSLDDRLDILEPTATIYDVGKTMAAKTITNGKVTEYEFITANNLPNDIKNALLACFEHVAWIDNQGQSYYTALQSALYPPANIAEISAVYTQSGAVYNYQTLDSLRTDLVVTVHFFDSTSAVVTGYTLNGILAAGTSTITVTYGNKSTVFNVTVTATSIGVTSLTPTLNLNGAIIRKGDNINSLKQYLTVTAHYGNNTTAIIDSSDYTLSGTINLNTGEYDTSTQTITATYGESTGTFPVTVYNDLTLDHIALPSGYTQLSMIQSSRDSSTTGSYIDTEINGIDIDHVEYGMQLAETLSSSTNAHVLGSTRTWYPYFRKGSSGLQKMQGKYKLHDDAATEIDFTWESNVNYIIKAYPTVEINGSTITTLTSGGATIDTNVFIFARGTSDNNPRDISPLRLFYLKMFNDQDQLIHNFVPCKNDENIVGLYDTVSEVFHTSANDSYSFIAGEAI